MAAKRDPQSAWRSLTWGQRHAVYRCSRHGQMHPDPGVAEISLNWARDQLAPRPEARPTGWSLGAFVAGLFGDAALGGWVGGSLFDWRMARRIVHVSDGGRT